MLERPSGMFLVNRGDTRHDALMSESRQQRRARERAAAKAPTRPGPHAQPGPERRARPAHPRRQDSASARRPAVLDVEVGRYDDPDDLDYVGWSAEWGLRGSSSGTEHASDNLQEVVDAVVDEAQELSARYELWIEWSLSGDEPEGKTLNEAVADAGVTLPNSL